MDDKDWFTKAMKRHGTDPQQMGDYSPAHDVAHINQIIAECGEYGERGCPTEEICRKAGTCMAEEWAAYNSKFPPTPASINVGLIAFVILAVGFFVFFGAVAFGGTGPGFTLCEQEKETNRMVIHIDPSLKGDDVGTKAAIDACRGQLNLRALFGEPKTTNMFAPANIYKPEQSVPE